MKSHLNAEKLANLVRSKRGTRGLRETAKDIGNVSPSTISRIEKGKTPDMETFLALCEWLEVSPAELIQNTEEEQDLDTPEAIAIQLRADKNLDPAIANALASLVKAAYPDLSQKQEVNSDKNENPLFSKPEYTLEELLAGASSEDFAGEYDWGEVVGEEIW
ncbi:helix-turn-helix domain-containing protein [Crocosphaera sp.]|uniref:helix-turn-helix domain-containing protein n=1 Tax=Crocosphaera sp. TaxID=2729996 RepID=UPI0026393AA3|nr:helix-turn-helix domain-containing protein [Crocosphaera sp.]MDJ0579330.1 helix-turn-helix domain-containing protein [Crocosphaera sp.]